MMSRLALFFLVIYVCGSCVNAQTVKTNPPGYRLSPEDFALMPWGTSFGDQAIFDTISECGFNLAGFVHAGDLDKTHKANLKAFVVDEAIHGLDATKEFSDDEITSRVNSVASKVKDHPARYGYYVRDEPAAAMFPTLGRWASAIRKADPGARAYINLFPIYVGDWALGGTYDDYLNNFAKTVDPPFISYDNYSLMDDGSLRPGYFSNLEKARAAGLRNNKPFWNIVLGNAHFTYAEPTPATLRFQAFTTLAYGARGLSYFTYFAPAIGNYRLAPMDQFGNKTPTWDAMRNVNLQIHALGKTYLGLKSVHVFHHPKQPDDTTTGIETSKFVKALNGGQFCVGEFEDAENNPWVLVVNTSLTASANYAIEFKRPGHIDMVNSYTAARQRWSGENNWLAPGQGMLLTLAKE